jgi:PAS domain S-box-containing protein
MNTKIPANAVITQNTLLQLILSSPNGVSLTDENGQITLWNPALENIVGIPAVVAIGKPIWDIQFQLATDTERTPVAYNSLRDMIQRLLVEGPGAWSEKPTERWIQLRGSEKRLIQTTLFALQTEAGFQLGSIIRDITADHARMAQLKVLTEAVEQSPVSVVITDPEGIIEYGNPLLTALTGYELEDVKGNTPRIFQSGLTPPHIYDQLWATIRNGRPWHGELQNRKKNGDLFWERISISPVLGDDGAIQHFVAIKEDITSYRQTEQALRESEQLFRMTFEQAAVGIAHVAPDGHFLRINEKFCELIGYSRAEMLSRRFQDITHPDDLNTDLSQVQQMLAGFIENYTLEKRYIRKDGSIQWVQLTVALTWHDDRTPKYFISVAQDISRRKATEQALRDSEERFRSLVTSTDDIIFTLDTQQRYTGVYGQWLAKGDFDSNDFLGKRVTDIVGEAEAPVHQQANTMALQGNPVVYEWSTLNRVLQIALSPLHDETNQVYGLVGIGRDISNLKQVEQQLREAERFARSTIDSLSTEIVILDEAGTIIMVNEAWRQFAQANAVDPDVVSEGTNYLSVLESVDQTNDSDEDAATFLSGIRQVMRGELNGFTLEYPCHAPDKQRWFLGRVTRFIGEGPLRLVISHENITERKIAEMTVRDSNQQLEILHESVRRQNVDLEAKVSERTHQLKRLNDRMTTILDNISDAILLLNGKGHIESGNASFGRLFGYDNDEDFGIHIGILADASSQTTLTQAMEIAQNQLDGQRFQVIARRKDGSTFDADVALAYVKDNGGHIVCSLRDITPLKEVERMKDQFISMVSHELRTPISTILLSSETLSNYYERLTDAQKTHKLRQIQGQALMLSELINAILDTARFAERRHKPSIEKADLVTSLESVVYELQPQAENSQQELTISSSIQLAVVPGEPTDVKRIWRNLVSNAIKYAGNGAEITAAVYESTSLTAENKIVQLGILPPEILSQRYIIGIVSDNGPGISEQDKAHLFTRFFRGWAAGTNIHGTGLGLSLVKDILQSYGGDITVHSQANVKTMFCFWLPKSN